LEVREPWRILLQRNHRNPQKRRGIRRRGFSSSKPELKLTSGIYVAIRDVSAGIPVVAWTELPIVLIISENEKPSYQGNPPIEFWSYSSFGRL
jgi:hypothetical protein